MTKEITACVTEDSDNCYWNAPTMGNGAGDSFISIDGQITYIEGCSVGEGLPAVDYNDADGWWAYCEPALGNEQVEMPQELAATGIEDVQIEFLGLGLLLIVAGVVMMRKGRRS